MGHQILCHIVCGLWRGTEAVITGRSWKPLGRKPTWVRIPPSPPFCFESYIHLYFVYIYVKYKGGIRTPSISRANSEEKEMRRPDDRKHLLRHFVSNLIFIYILYIFILSIKVGFSPQIVVINRTSQSSFSWTTSCVRPTSQSSFPNGRSLGLGLKRQAFP